MRHSENITELAAALVTAAGQLTDPHRTRTARTGKYSYQYASLPDILPAVRATLSANSLAVLQECGDAYCTTRIQHATGQWIESDWPLEIETGRMAGAQARGSAATYARRYSLLALLGMAADDDDDGAAASQPTKRAAPVPVSIPSPKVPPEEQRPCDFLGELPGRLGNLAAAMAERGPDLATTVSTWATDRGYPDPMKAEPTRQRALLKYLSSSKGQADLLNWLGGGGRPAVEPRPESLNDFL